VKTLRVRCASITLESPRATKPQARTIVCFMLMDSQTFAVMEL
jgi:hypothetical protein